MAESKLFIQSTNSSSNKQQCAPQDGLWLPLRLSTSRLRSLVAFLLQLAVAIFLVVIVCVEVNIRHPGALSNAQHNLYVAGITLAATLIAKYTTSEIRKLWILHTASKRPESHGHLSVLIGLGSFHSQVHLWPISSSFLITGLITTAIVAGLNLSNVPGE
jgi:hypothetical protein